METTTLSKDYFDLFGLPATYQIDISALTKRYKELQHTIHPDKFVSASENDKGLSIRLTAHVNDAYETLKDPLIRARYLLQARGVDMDEEKSNLSPEFLGEQLEMREQLEEIHDSETPLDDMVSIRNTIEKRINHLKDRLQELFTANTASALEQAKSLYYEMQFMFRLQDELDELEDELV